MKKILITGFEPFGGDELNASWEAVRALPDMICGTAIVKTCIPVVFGEAARTVIEKAVSDGVDGIICVGQAGGRDKITPERLGVNSRMARIPDNAGNMPADEKICPVGKDSETSTFNVDRMAEAMASAGIPSAVSEDAGRYVCNDLLYSILHRFSGTDVKCTFIHVPYFDLQNTDGKPSLPLEVITDGLYRAIASAVTEARTDHSSLCTSLKALVDGVPHMTANLANAAALLYNSLHSVNWAGFYLRQGDSLVLGPFCGKPACISIPMGKGVCGSAASAEKTLVVPDVHSFPGHIACDGASNSEIVIPLMKNGEVIGVLDIDSPVPDRFSDEDRAGLEAFAKIIEDAIAYSQI